MTFSKAFKLGLLATAGLIASVVPASADPISIALLTTVGFSQAAIGGTLLAATTAGLQILAGTALSIGLNMLSTALSEKPKGIGGSQAQVQIGADVPRQIMFGRGATAGCPVYISGKTQKNHILTIIFRLADWECDSLETIWVEGDKRTLTSVSVVGSEHARYAVSGTSNKIYVKFFRGTMTQTADAELINDETNPNGTRIGTWTSAHRLAGICYASVRIEYDQENMPSVPSFVFGLKGAKLYDWRKDTTNGGSGSHRWADPTTWEWSENPAVCDYNFRRGFYRNGIRVLGMGVPVADLLHDYYTAAANVCDESVAEGGATEKRYTVGVLVPDDAEWRVPVDAFRVSMAGESIERAGCFGVIAGGSYSPVMTLTDDDMRADAPSSFSRKMARSELYNAVAVTWANPAIRYESDTLTPLTDATYETQDNSERIVRDVDLSMVYKPYQARRIGQIILEQSRMQAVHTGVYPARFSALEPGDWVTKEFNRDGLGTAVMKVVSIKETEPEWYEITLRQAAASNFTPPTGTITIPVPPGTTQSVMIPGTPGVPSLSEAVALNADGTAISTITATWPSGVNAVNYIVGITASGAEVEFNVGGALRYSFAALAGATYQVRVRSVDVDGTKGNWTSATSITATGDTVAPSAPSGLATAGDMKAILLTWTNPTDDDLAGVEVWGSSTNNLAGATKLTTVVGTRWTHNGLAIGAVRYYWVKAIDRTGNVSTSHPSSSTAGVSGTALGVTAADLADDAKPIERLSALPATGNFQGRIVFLTTDNKIYRHTGSPTDASGFTVATDGADILANSVTANKMSVASLSAISANVGTVTAGMVKSGTSGMQVDLDNNRIQSGGFDANALTGFKLDGATGTLTANSVTIAGGTSSKRPFGMAFGAVQDGILSDESTANIYLPASLTNSKFGDVYGTIRRTPTENVYNLTVNPLFPSGGNVGNMTLAGGYPRAEGILCAPASQLIFSRSSPYENGYLIIDQFGDLWFDFVGTETRYTSLNNTWVGQDWLGTLYNPIDIDPLFNATYAQTTVHIWKSVLVGGIRRIRVPDTVTVSGTPTAVAGMRVWMWGAAGQWGSGHQGGPGGFVKFDHAVTPGEILSLQVGSYNGNGWGGVSPNYVDGNNERGSTSLVSQGGGGSFLWRGPTKRANLLGVAGGGGSGGRLRNGGVGGSASYAGGNGVSGSLMDVCVGITSLGNLTGALGTNLYGSASGGGGYVGGGRLGTSNPDNEAGRGGSNYIIGTATSTTNSSSVTSNQDANGAANTLTTQGTSESVYTAATYDPNDPTWYNYYNDYGCANVGCASATESAAGAGMICIQWLT